MSAATAEKPTQKQLEYIHDIEEVLGTEFKGSTKKEASIWLNKKVPMYKQELKQMELDREAELDMIDARRN